MKQSVKLEQLIKEKGVIEALSEVTELTDTALLNKIFSYISMFSTI